MKGLYAKYLVFKAKTPDPCGCREAACPHVSVFGEKPVRGDPVDGCFVLRPEKDMAARGALRVYALLTADIALAKSLNVWLDGLPSL